MMQTHASINVTRFLSAYHHFRALSVGASVCLSRLSSSHVRYVDVDGLQEIEKFADVYTKFCLNKSTISKDERVGNQTHTDFNTDKTMTL